MTRDIVAASRNHVAKFFKAFFPAIALGLLATGCVSPSTTTRPMQTDDYRILDNELATIVNDPARPLASLSVVAVRNGKIVYQRQFGRRWIDEARPELSRPVDAQTLYRIASISKLITTIGVMRLVEEGRLDLDAEVSTYLGFPLRNPHFPADVITLRMLMSHTSSLRDDAGYYFDQKSGLTLADVLVPGGRGYGSGAMWATNAKAGAYFQYANLPWGVIGTVMERVTGERFDHLMRRLVLDPLELAGGFNPAEFTPAQQQNVATLYRKRTADDREIWNPAGPWIPQTDDFVTAPPVPRVDASYVAGTNGTLVGPQGNCRLTGEGLSHVMLMLSHQGTWNGRHVLKPASVAEMLGEQWRFDGAGQNGNSGGEFVEAAADKDQLRAMNSWGLGVQRFTDLSQGAGKGDRLVEPGGFRAVGHLGDAYGLTSAIVFDPETATGLIFLIGGVGADPKQTPGAYSALSRYEERILSALYMHAIRRPMLQRGDGVRVDDSSRE
jgi:CubicO group peptidase (beta-lactamase class C family)